MPAENREPLESSQPLQHALAVLDAALSQLQTLKKHIESNISSIGSIRQRLGDQSARRNAPRNIEGLEVAIAQSRKTLEALQSIETGSSLDHATRFVAKGLAMLYTLHKAAIAKPPPKRVAPKPVPKHIKDRRASPRAAVEAEIGFQSDTNFYTGFTEDISTGGIFLATFDLRPIGSVINVNFTLPGGHFISADGRVRWVREYNELNPDMSPGMGVQFDDLGSDDKDAIVAFIQQRSTLFFEEDN